MFFKKTYTPIWMKVNKLLSNLFFVHFFNTPFYRFQKLTNPICG